MEAIFAPLIQHAPGMVALIIVVGYFLRHMKWQGEQQKEDRSATREVMGELNHTLKANNQALATTTEHARKFDDHIEHIKAVRQTVERIEPQLIANTEALKNNNTVLGRVEHLIKHEETRA